VLAKPSTYVNALWTLVLTFVIFNRLIVCSLQGRSGDLECTGKTKQINTWTIFTWQCVISDTNEEGWFSLVSNALLLLMIRNLLKL
jgi:hypothetical protein